MSGWETGVYSLFNLTGFSLESHKPRAQLSFLSSGTCPQHYEWGGHEKLDNSKGLLDRQWQKKINLKSKEYKVLLTAFDCVTSCDLTAALVVSTHIHDMPSQCTLLATVAWNSLRFGLSYALNCSVFAAHIKFSALTETQQFNAGKQRRCFLPALLSMQVSKFIFGLHCVRMFDIKNCCLICWLQVHKKIIK